MKNGKPLFHHVLQCVSCWKKELPDGDRRQGRRDYTKCPGTRSRGTWAGDRCYPTASKIHRRQLVADARPDSAQKTGCQGHRFPIHRCTVGPRRHFDGRRESLHASTRGVPSCGAGAHRAPGVGRVASNRRPAEQVHERSHRRQQYHRTARRTGRPVPRLWRHLARRAGRDEDPPAVGLPHRLDPPTANHPRAAPATLPTRSPRRSPRPGRCRCSTWATSVWIGSRTSRGPVLFGSLGCSMARRSSTPKASPWRCCNTCGSRQGRDRSTCRSCWA